MSSVALVGIAKASGGGRPWRRSTWRSPTGSSWSSSARPAAEIPLLRIVAGLEQPTGAMWSFGGEWRHHGPPARRGVAMVFHPTALPGHDAFEEHELGLEQAPAGRAEIERRCPMAADSWRILDLLDPKPASLRRRARRVVIGRAITREPTCSC